MIWWVHVHILSTASQHKLAICVHKFTLASLALSNKAKWIRWGFICIMRWWYLEVLILLPNCRSPKLNFFFLILAIKIFLALDHKKADKWLGVHSDIGLFVCEYCATLVKLHIHRYEKSFPWVLVIQCYQDPSPNP